MKVYSFPDPPNPDDVKYSKNSSEYLKDNYKWAAQIKSLLQNQTREIGKPADQYFYVSSYTDNFTLNGTSTTADIANFVCSLITALRNKGLLKTINTQQ